MNQHHDPNHDPLRKWVNKDLLDDTSAEFTGKVLDQLGLATKAKSVAVEPAISRKGWIMIFLVAATILGLALTGDSAFTLPSTGFLLAGTSNEILSRTTGLLSGSMAALLAFASLAVLILFTFESWYRSRRLGTAF